MLRFQDTAVTERSKSHVVIHVGCVVFALVSQVCSLFFFYLTQPNGLLVTGFIPSIIHNGSDIYNLEVSMDWWSDYNWILIDSWTMFWLLEAVVNVFRRNALGPLCCNPEIHPPMFYVLWICVNVARIFLKVLVPRHDMVENITLVWSLPVFSFFLLFWSYINLQKHKSWLSINNPEQIWWIRFSTQNGVALFAWWTFLKSVLCLGILLRNIADEPLVSSIVLTIILGAAFIWFILQSFVFRTFMRDTFTVYPILVLGIGSMFTHSYSVNSFSQNTMYCGFLMLIMTFMSLFHLVSACLYQDRPLTRPLHTETRMVLQTVYQPDNKQQKF